MNKKYMWVVELVNLLRNMDKTTPATYFVNIYENGNRLEYISPSTVGDIHNDISKILDVLDAKPVNKVIERSPEGFIDFESEKCTELFSDIGYRILPFYNIDEAGLESVVIDRDGISINLRVHKFSHSVDEILKKLYKGFGVEFTISGLLHFEIRLER